MQSLFKQSWKDGAYYNEQWTQFYALRKKLWHQLLLGLLPFVGAIILIAVIPEQWQARVPYLSVVLGVLSFAAWLVSAIRFFTVGWKIQAWNCPRCGETFFIGKGVRNPFARRCGHCELYRPKQSELATLDHNLHRPSDDEASRF
jgi:hypothetical protein